MRLRYLNGGIYYNTYGMIYDIIKYEVVIPELGYRYSPVYIRSAVTWSSKWINSWSIKAWHWQQKQHFGTFSMMCNIFQWTRLSVLRTIGEPTLETTEATVGYAVWWVPRQLWAPGPPRNQRNDTLTAIVLAVGGALLKQTVCVLMCLLSDGTTTPLQANGTHKNQTGQAEGRSKHTLPLLTPFFPALPSSSLAFLSEPLKCQTALRPPPSPL